MKLVFKKVFGVLTPIDEAGQKFMGRVQNGDLVDIDVKRPRNIRMHNKWWAMCSYLAQNSDRLPTAEHASKWLLVRLGYCTWIRDRVGNALAVADSISFASMDQSEFEQMYDKACDLICEMLPAVTNETVRQVLAEFAGVGALLEAS